MAALGPTDPPDPMWSGADPDDDTRLDVVESHYLDLYRKTLEEIAHSPEYMAECSPCPGDDMYTRCPRCLAREALDS